MNKHSKYLLFSIMQLDIPVIGILRGVDASQFGEIMAASFSAGLQAIEVTMNTKQAEGIVSEARHQVPPGKLLGMGTIRNLEEAKRAQAAGAMFFVSPNCDEAVIDFARAQGLAIIAGAFTPTEAYAAWSAGANMVKIFPCGVLGPRYIHDLLGPFEKMPLMAVGGITASNVREYFEAGVRAVGVSQALFGREALAASDMKALAGNVKAFISGCPGNR